MSAIDIIIRDPGEAADHRNRAIQTACVNTYEGTADLVTAIIGESKNHAAWRPGRAGSLRALHDETHQGGVWMTSEEFSTWITRQAAANRKQFGAGYIKPIQQIGMTSKRKLRILAGAAEATKVEALACAHVAMGFDCDAQLLGSEQFAEWVSSNFGHTSRVAAWLGVDHEKITDRMRGFDIVKGERRPREPEVGLIRALDWLLRCGPFCPYGDRGQPAVFPGQGPVVF